MHILVLSPLLSTEYIQFSKKNLLSNKKISLIKHIVNVFIIEKF